jgi:alkylated DNA repair dioxygenase AlkB
MPSRQPDLFPQFPEGFRYREDALTPAHETELLTQLQALPFTEFQFRGFEGKRRVVSFGWHYSFNDHQLHQAEPVPDFLHHLYAEILASTGFALSGLHHALVTEYTPGAAIGWHKDRPVFDRVIGISLASPCTLRLRKPPGPKWQRVSLTLEPRSAYLFEGPARRDWEHSIPPVEATRYSITFRDLRRAP